MRTGTQITGGMRGAAAAALLCLPAFPAFAAFEDLGAGARGPGMGDAMCAIAGDVYSVHYNPAGLGTLTRPEFGAAYTQHFIGLTDGSNLGTSFFGYAHPLAEGKKGAIAAAYNAFSLDGGLYSENTLYLSYGRLAYEKGDKALYAGATLKHLGSSFGSFKEAQNATNGILSTGQSDPLLKKRSLSALDADAGLLYQFGTHYAAGLQATRLLSPDMASAGSDKLKPGVKAAFNYRSLISNLALQAETKAAPGGGTDNVVTVAAERWFPRSFSGDFAFRGALSGGSREYKQISAGLSYRNRRLQVDYAFGMPIGTLTGTSGSHRMGVTFHFGKSTAQEETLEMLMEALAAAVRPEAVVKTSTVTLYAGRELTEEEKLIADKLARAEEAIRAERYREAVGFASSVAEIAPENAAAWQNMGTAYLGLGQYKSSLYSWNKAYQYEKSPALREAIRGYIRSITRLERAGAKPAAKKRAGRISLTALEIEELLNRGVNYYVAGEFDKAREMFEKVLSAEPDNVEALKSLRRLEEEKGR